MKEKNKMAYTSSDAIKTFFDYLGITQNDVYVIPDTKNRGMVYKNKNGEDCVIFISPISYSSYNDKGFFDTRDSGPKERIITWNYAVQKKLKYFNVAVQGIVEKYKDYIFSLECNEDRIQLVSGSSDVERRATSGTQIVIGRNCLTDKKFERFKTEYGFFIADVYKDYFEEYIVTFDNRPYTQKLEQIHFDGNDNSKNEEFIPLNYTPFSAKDKIKSYNRIIFGAPGTGKSFRLNDEANKSNFAEITRVTFHPDYSYSQFVGTYKPVMVKNKSKATDENVSQTIEILQDKTKTAQEKYDLLYDKFKDNNLTTLPFLLGLYTDDNFTTLKKDGTATADDNSAERNHGKAIRPYINLKSQDDNETISYKYVPGPFLQTLVAALKSGKSGNPQNYLLIIEEINRARVAAVFGDVFQLLDRNADGESEYKIQTSEDMRNYLAEQLGGNPDEYKTLKLPNNFYLWATMNSADQGVFPMDTAFKRRWNFEYIGIDENESGVSTYDIPINEKAKVNWNDLRKAINSKLILAKVNEDKLLGPYFISENDLKNAMQKPADFIKLFKSKVIMYLFEDAAKMKKDFFKLTNERKYIYSDVCKELDENGIAVFNFSEDEKGALKEEKTVGSNTTMTN